MQYVDATYNIEYEIKKSKFISYITPYSNFKNQLNILKLKHKKARHIIWSYRYFNEYNQIVENLTDDGEPKGVAGRPTLDVLQGNNIINCAIITVRYFGGIKLGMGGMVRAYSSSANLIISSADFIQYITLNQKTIEIPYNILSILEYKCKKLNINIVSKIFHTNIKIVLEGRREDLELITY